jgi:hypothetical protein
MQCLQLIQSFFTLIHTFLRIRSLLPQKERRSIVLLEVRIRKALDRDLLLTLRLTTLIILFPVRHFLLKLILKNIHTLQVFIKRQHVFRPGLGHLL